MHKQVSHQILFHVSQGVFCYWITWFLIWVVSFGAFRTSLFMLGGISAYLRFISNCHWGWLWDKEWGWHPKKSGRNFVGWFVGLRMAAFSLMSRRSKCRMQTCLLARLSISWYVDLFLIVSQHLSNSTKYWDGNAVKSNCKSSWRFATDVALLFQQAPEHVFSNLFRQISLDFVCWGLSCLILYEGNTIPHISHSLHSQRNLRHKSNKTARFWAKSKTHFEMLGKVLSLEILLWCAQHGETCRPTKAKGKGWWRTVTKTKVN